MFKIKVKNETSRGHFFFREQNRFTVLGLLFKMPKDWPWKWPHHLDSQSLGPLAGPLFLFLGGCLLVGFGAVTAWFGRVWQCLARWGMSCGRLVLCIDIYMKGMLKTKWGDVDLEDIEYGGVELRNAKQLKRRRSLCGNHWWAPLVWFSKGMGPERHQGREVY